MNKTYRLALVALVGLAALTLSASPIALQQNPAVTQMPDGTVVVDSLSSPSEFGWRCYTVNADPSLLRPNARYGIFKCELGKIQIEMGKWGWAEDEESPFGRAA